MRPILKSYLHRVGIVLLVWMLFSGCRLFSSMTSGEAAPTRPVSSQPTAIDESVSAEPTKSLSSDGAGPLQIGDAYPFPFSDTKWVVGSSLAASPDKVWIGTLNGTIEEVDAQSGAFGRSLSLVPGAGGDLLDAKPILQLTFEGGYLWALGDFFESGMSHPLLLAIDADRGTVAQQWDLYSSDWLGDDEESQDPENFCTAPGKIWIDNHVIDARTFEVTRDELYRGIEHCTYNGNGWMWMTSWTGLDRGDGLFFAHADDFTEGPYQRTWPFLIHENGLNAVQGDSIMALAGDRMWIGMSQFETGSVGVLDAYPPDLDDLMKLSGPLVRVPLLESLQDVRLLYAGDYLWVLYVGGEHGGWLYQLDPQTGKTLVSLDLVGDEGRTMGDFPMDIASAGDNLWVVTTQQLLRIKMP